MSISEQFKSLKNVRCNFGGHDISLEDEDKLYASGKDEIDDVKCKRCGMPLKLKIDPKDKEYYFISEKEFV